MPELFNRESLSDWLRSWNESISSDIEKITNEEILNTDIDEWANYLCSKYTISPISLYMENVAHELKEIKVKQYNSFYNHNPYESEYFSMDGYRVTFTIPFDGNEKLLYLQASTYIMSRFEVDFVGSPTSDELGKIRYSLEYTKKELESKDNQKEFILSQFKGKFDKYLKNINYINIEVERFNDSLSASVKESLETRRKKTEDYITMRSKLDLPLNINPNAPNTVPIMLKKKPKTISPRPTFKPQKPEYAISDENYVNINNIISMSCNSMEKAASTFIKLQEEELRDIIISHLNTHYSNVTGETFNKVGKTDIHILSDSKAAYIAECKIWHGEKKFKEALEQLFSYTTWRDVKTSLIVFNKENKNFVNVLSVIENYLETCPSCRSKCERDKNEWQCTFQKSIDSDEIISVFIGVYDLCC